MTLLQLALLAVGLLLRLSAALGPPGQGHRGGRPCRTVPVPTSTAQWTVAQRAGHACANLADPRSTRMARGSRPPSGVVSGSRVAGGRACGVLVVAARRRSPLQICAAPGMGRARPPRRCPAVPMPGACGMLSPGRGRRHGWIALTSCAIPPTSPLGARRTAGSWKPAGSDGLPLRAGYAT